MPEFNAHHALAEATERHELLTEGAHFVPIAAAVVAVLAALATLFSNHSSVSGLEKRTLAAIYQTRAADNYSYYESSRLKIEVNQAILQSGLSIPSTARSSMSGRISKEQQKSQTILSAAQKNEEQANGYLESAERHMTRYEHFEWAATLFEVSIVLISITALMRTKLLMYAGFALTLVGLSFFFLGFA